MGNTRFMFQRASVPLLLIGAILLNACATSAPRQYNQSAFVPAPRAPVFEPTTDAPIEIGHPGVAPIRPAIEPNPKPTRVLPETPETRREAGIWASVDASPEAPLLLGFPPLDESEAKEAPTYVLASRSCASMMDRALRMANEAVRVSALSATERACLAARLYLACSSITDQRGNPVSERIRAIVVAHRDRACRDVNDSVSRHLDGIERNATREYLARINEMDEKMKRSR